ncbi:hypothetical protein VNO80_01312 [Phaseolus coccineus]|uniref:Uncharacterized protein n=1 Tax=Phaseolus coccineus TaxID=3886 RepID=A0AAN9RSP4_PHACN
MSLALAMSACLSRPGHARMSLAPWRCPHASRPGDARMPRALAMPACLSRPGDARMPRAMAMSVCLSRPGDARMPRALAMSACLSRAGDVLTQCDAHGRESVVHVGELSGGQRNSSCGGNGVGAVGIGRPMLWGSGGQSSRVAKVGVIGKFSNVKDWHKGRGVQLSWFVHKG